MTPKAQAFVSANAASPVVFGSAPIRRPGAYYRLLDGQAFRLSGADLKSMPADWRPVWHLPIKTGAPHQ